MIGSVVSMDLREDSARLESLRAAMSRHMSSSSSAAFFSANQSPFFSPRSCQLSESTRSDAQCDGINLSADPPSSSSGIQVSECLPNVRFSDFGKFDHVSSATPVPNGSRSSYDHMGGNGYSGPTEKHRKHMRRHDISFSPVPISLSSNRRRSYDVYVGLHGLKPSLLRFANWFRAELEVQGISCFVSDRAQFRNSRKHELIERAMDVSSFGVVILTRKSLRNPYTIEELRFFSSKKNLVPIYFDLKPDDCLVRDIVEKRGELWEKHGGELWILYGGLEKEWKEAVTGLFRVDEWKLEAQDGNWRDCILRAVTVLAMKLGRRSVLERLTKWRDKVDKEEFPFPRNENFIGRKKELSELEFILFGDITGKSKRDYFELKARSKRKNLAVGWSKSGLVEERRREQHRESASRKGKDPVIWKESEKEIEMQSAERQHYQRPKGGGRNSRRKRATKIVYGKGVACVTGDSGIGKTELLLEFAYRFHQRYKMVLWIGGERQYIRQNYLNLWSFLEVDVGVENFIDKSRFNSFEEQEEAAISRVRKELMRNIPFLVVIDNLESEKDWWDHKLVMDLLPRFGGETHILISTRLPRVMNLEPLKLSYLSEVEAMSLMQGSIKDYPIAEIDALRIIEEKVGRLTLALAIIGAILSELPINPSRLLDTINRMPSRDISWSGREAHLLRKNTFLLQLFEVCFSIFDHTDGPRSLATRMVLASGWFAPAAIPVSLLAIAAHKIPDKRKGTRFWRKLLRSLTCGFSSSYSKRSEAEASSMLLRFNIARTTTKEGCFHFNELIKVYARKRGVTGVAQAMVQAVVSHGSLSLHSEHMWAACFLLFGFGNNPKVVELRVSELLYLVKQVILPLAIWTFTTFSRCCAALELLRVCTDALEAADQAFLTPVEKWFDKSLCWRPIQTNAQLNPYLWEELAVSRATVLETRAKLMLRGGQFDIGDDLIRKAIFIRTSICGENHPDTVSARETLSKLTRLLANVQTHPSS
ncbi:TIR-NBS17 [Hibiscus trionum]|uniref:TIR-NBS17 n=1 Tax=Hibiscus trionum TaxID=183268 RepID=A0A9W7HXF4_HIBTR|nr:TIR-NBS17 [Hibiscus trionum]